MAEEYSTFISHVKQKAGIDLTLYKEAQMKRRLTSLRNKRGFSNFTDYYNALATSDQLLKEFVDRITINVSEFYRNPKRWDVLQSTVFPHLLQNKKELTIWSAACSTGEEPYSIALMIKEYFPSTNIQIIATDIDENVLQRAKEGIYQEQSLKELPNEIKKKHFKQIHGLFHIESSIKQLVTFRKHNLLADKYPENVDLIVCRNVLIYFTDQAKNIIYQNFSNALTKEGVLFVGSTEQIFSPQKYQLSLLNTFFYQKN